MKQSYVKFLNRTVSFISIVYPLTALPQIIKVWVYHQTEGLSLLTWVLWLVVTLILLSYTIVHKEKRLTLLWSLWVVVYVVVIVGILVYQ